MSSDHLKRDQQLRARSTLVLLSHFPLSDSPTWVLARGLAYQPSVALVIMTLYQLYYIALDPFFGVSDAVIAPSSIASASRPSLLCRRAPLVQAGHALVIRVAELWRARRLSHCRPLTAGHVPPVVGTHIPERDVHIPLPTCLGAVSVRTQAYGGTSRLDRLHGGMGRAVYRSWRV